MVVDKVDCRGTKEEDTPKTNSDTSLAGCLDNRISLSVASGPQASSGADEASADEISNPQDDNAAACANGSKRYALQCFEKTYHRKRGRMVGDGKSRKGKHIDGLFLLASAAANEPLPIDKTSSSSEVNDSCLRVIPLKSEPVMNLHDPLNFGLMEKLKAYLNERGCGISSGWKVRHKECRCTGTHLYISPKGVRFSSMESVMRHVIELKGDVPSMDITHDHQKLRGLNRMSSVSACPHVSLIGDNEGHPTFSIKPLAACRNRMQRELSQESDDQTILSRETHDSVESGMVDEKHSGSPLPSQQEQTESRGLLKSCCSKCGEVLDTDNSLICDGCEAAHHVHCVDVTDIPSQRWYCASCSLNGRVSSPEPNSTSNPSPIKDDHCVMCEGIRFPTIYGMYEPMEHHCVVCERLYEHRQMLHHCAVCERLYNLAREHVQLQVERTRNGVPLPKREFHLQLAGSQKPAACKLCQMGDKDDQGMAACANEGCYSRYYHIGCLNPPLRELPPSGWYCPSCLCRACLVNENDDRIVLCDGCDEGYHTYCMKPSLLRIPRGNWYCCSCRERRPERTNVMQSQYSAQNRSVGGHGKGRNLKKAKKRKRKVLSSNIQTGTKSELKSELTALEH